MPRHLLLGLTNRDITLYTWPNALPELVDMIFSYIHLDSQHYGDSSDDAECSDDDIKREASRLSLTCRRWSLALRPRLFHTLRLRDRSDLPFLLSIVRSPLSGWLAYHVVCIIFDLSYTDADRLRMSPFIWRTLCESLPVARTLMFGRTHSSTDDKDSLFPWRDRPFLSALPNIQNLFIENLRFVSLSSMLRLLGSIPSLATVVLFDVRWKGALESEEGVVSPNCPIKLPRLDVFFLQNCTDSRSSVWAFLQACSLVRLAHRGRVGIVPLIPASATVITALMDIFFEHDDDLVVAKQCDARGGPCNNIHLPKFLETSLTPSM